ncbi:hypothetical protein [Streptomyces sp. NPDC048385]|uniref:hypothetical protein n=1 Tax=unclassified Streptomyces TaxID=2593676 RepID=UPI00341B0B93
MEAIAAVIAVLGTLMGSGLTYVFQQRNTIRQQQYARAEKLRQERLDAFATCGGALANYRRGQMDLWFGTHRHQGQSDIPELNRESQRLRAVALEAIFRVDLLTDDGSLAAAGRHALKMIDRLYKASSERELDLLRATTRDAIDAFVSASRPQVTVGSQ